MGQISLLKNLGGIKGLSVIIPTIHGDNRGYFLETYNKRDLEEVGINIQFVQDNQSLSSKGVLRGLHFQKRFPQAKLVRVITGSIFDVVVDLRLNSDTFGKWFGIELNDKNFKQLFIPQGFAHGFLVLSDFAEICYKCDNYYQPNDEGGIAWNDPDLCIDWPGLEGNYDGSALASGYKIDGLDLKMSNKDQSWHRLRDVQIPNY